MCGIVGIVNGKNVAGGLISGLRNLEYRGYDSVGIATLGARGLDRRRAKGKIAALESHLAEQPLDGPVGIGHTRWATHGSPTVANAHPHIHTGIAVVHNGIIENFKELREELTASGVTFQSETDSEVVPALVAYYRSKGMSIVEAIRKTTSRLDGQFALSVLSADAPGVAFAARHESPLALGGNKREALIASDMLAFSGRAEEEMFLENGDIAVVERNRIQVFDTNNVPACRPVKPCLSSQVQVERNGHRHFMHKEIHEQQHTIANNLQLLGDRSESGIQQLPRSLVMASRISIVACGTSFYAGSVARGWFERFAGIPVDLEVASEFRYRELPITHDGAALFISQSGETADTLAAMRLAKNLEVPTAAIVNVQTSAIAREADFMLPTITGPEIGVASTKAFTAQLSALLTMAVAIGRAKGRVDDDELKSIRVSLEKLPVMISKVLASETGYKKVAKAVKKSTSAIFVGRGASFGLAMEGALKLKEISYIHAEGFAAGELKHGPIALIDEDVPAFVLAPRDALYQKTISNAQEIAARSGRVFLLSDKEGCEALSSEAEQSIVLPDTDTITAPFVYAIALQLIAYHTAVAKGTDVDQPRNLAKSVTVE